MTWIAQPRAYTLRVAAPAGTTPTAKQVIVMRKDLGIVLEEARSNGAKLPLTALVDQFYADVQAMGGKRWDTSSLLARLER